MIKLTACPNISKREISKAIESGRTFCIVSDTDNPIHWDDNHGNNPVRCGTKPWNWRGFKYLFEITESHWYEDSKAIGKAVKVKQRKSDNWQIDFFGSYALDGVDCFYCHRDVWGYAEPLTEFHLYQEPV